MTPILAADLIQPSLTAIVGVASVLATHYGLKLNKPKIIADVKKTNAETESMQVESALKLKDQYAADAERSRADAERWREETDRVTREFEARTIKITAEFQAELDKVIARAEKSEALAQRRAQQIIGFGKVPVD